MTTKGKLKGYVAKGTFYLLAIKMSREASADSQVTFSFAEHRMNPNIPRLINAIVLSSILVSLPVATASAAVMLSISPPASFVSVGDVFSLDVNISGVTDLYALEFDVIFNPAILSAVSVTEGSFLAMGGPTFFVPGGINNGSGQITDVGNLLLGLNGVSGAGSLVSITFSAIAPGNGSIELQSITLLDKDFASIGIDQVIHGAVTITPDNTTIPEPASLAIWGVGALVAALGACRRHHDSDPFRMLNRQLIHDL
jgi:Cohesin domain